MKKACAAIAIALMIGIAATPAALADVGSSGRNAEPGFQAASNFFAAFFAGGNLIGGLEHAGEVHVGRSDPLLDPLLDALDRMLARKREEDRARESDKAAEDLLQFTREVLRPDDYLPGLDD